MRVSSIGVARLVLVLVGVASNTLVGSVARAYPSSVVFVPSGEAKRLGGVTVFGYTAGVARPRSAPGASWFGVEAGVLPRVPYSAEEGQNGDKDALSFGGLELGADLFDADLQGTPDAYVKPVFNAKVQPLTEHDWSPSFAIGILGIAPGRPSRALNLVYGSATKTLGAPRFGRFTLGLARVGNDFSRDRFAAAHPAFRSSWPFATTSRLALLAGYESPAFGRFGLAVDHFGGVSEVSSTNLALNVTPLDGATWTLGAWIANDTRQLTSGWFTALTLGWDARALAR